jgi:phosphoribosylformimino-5-aminoimidazole carboxamide ribotide isomerase
LVALDLNFTVYPAVDISEGRCVRLLQGRFGTETVYSDDPVEVALGFARAGARWLHIVDLDGARSGVSANRELVIEVVRRASCPVQAGGGLRTLDDVEEILAAGANRAVLGTFALEDEAGVAEVCKRFGPRIAVSLDARGGELASHGWTVGTGVPVLDAVKIFESAGVSSFIYTDVTRDGTMSGPDVDGLLRLTEATDLPVIASGGISSLEDLRTIARLKADGVAGAIIGRALYEHKFSVGEAMLAADEAASGRNEPPLVER